MKENTGRETIVFAYDTAEQRRSLVRMFPGWFERDDGVRIVAESVDNEMRRVNLIADALERYDDHYELRDAIRAILDHPNLARFQWADIDASEDA